MSNKIERRCFHMEELRATVGDDGTVSGYAAVFNKLSEDLGTYGPLREKIEPGAFSNSIATGDVRAFWSHDPSLVLGRTKNRSLQLSEDATGLRFTLTPPNTTLGRDALESIKRGDVDAMSFGFRVLADQWEQGSLDTPTIRTLLDVELLEISPVAFPAYPQTSVRSSDIGDEYKAHMEAWEKESQGASGKEKNELRLKRLINVERFSKLLGIKSI